MNIVLIGTGNTATILGRKLKAAGHHIVQVFGRNSVKTGDLAKILNATAATETSDLYSSAELYLLAVADNAVAEIANKLPLTGQTVVHTAASVPLEVLNGKAEKYGVFYPLQSLKKEIRQLPAIPILVDASDSETLLLLKELATSISDNVLYASDETRVKMHLAAVMVNNFSNHLYALVENYCADENLDFQLLLPLLNETVLRLDDISPANAQTGPAARNDSITIAKHLTLLEKKAELKKFYILFTDSIRRSSQ